MPTWPSPGQRRRRAASAAVLREVERGDARPALGERVRHRRADPAGRAGDEDALRCEPLAEGGAERAARSRAWRDPVRLDVVAVELPAEPGRGRQRRCCPSTIGGRLAIRFHQIGSRSALKHLEERPVRDRGEQVRGDLRLLVVGHRDVERDAPPPRRGATRSGRPTTTSRSCRSRSPPRPSGRGSRRPRTRSARRRRARRRRSGRRASRGGRSTRCTAPRTSSRSRSSTEPRERGSPRPASSPGWRRRRARSRARRPSRAARNRSASSSGREPADLELHPGEPPLAQLRDLLGDVLRARSSRRS